MNHSAYIWAMIIGSLILEAICFYNIFILRSGGMSFILIIPIISFVAGIYLLFATRNKQNDKKD